MAYKLSISDKVTVPVKFTMIDAGKIKRYDFTLTCERVSASDWAERIKDADGAVTDARIKEQLIEMTTGWQGQTLVLDDAGQPAECNPEALAVLFDVAGVSGIVTKSYMKEFAAVTKN